MADQSDFAALLGEFERERQGSSQPDPEVGENVRGTILSITREHAFVELGAKYEGVMDIEALTNAEGQLTVDVGDRIEAVVIEKDEQTGTLLLGGRAAATCAAVRK